MQFDGVNLWYFKLQQFDQTEFIVWNIKDIGVRKSEFVAKTQFLCFSHKGATRSQRNWVFATNSDFLFIISLEPNVVDLRYFKLWILLDRIIWAWNIKGLQHQVLKILRFKYLILFQRLNSFEPIISIKLDLFFLAVSTKKKKTYPMGSYGASRLTWSDNFTWLRLGIHYL